MKKTKKKLVQDITSDNKDIYIYFLILVLLFFYPKTNTITNEKLSNTCACNLYPYSENL